MDEVKQQSNESKTSASDVSDGVSVTGHAVDEPPGGHGVDAAEDQPPMGNLFAIIAGLCVIVIGAVVALYAVFTVVASTALIDKEDVPPNHEILELRARDVGNNTTYAKLSESASAYRIPVERAMQIVASNPNLLSSVPQASASAVVAQASSPSPATSGTVQQGGGGSKPGQRSPDAGVGR